MILFQVSTEIHAKLLNFVKFFTKFKIFCQLGLTMEGGRIYNRNMRKEKNMKNQWAKTLLYVYKYLNRITDGIDKLVDRSALNSFYYCNNNQRDNTVLSVTNKIIQLIERKKRLVNIKVLVDKCLLSCDQLCGQLLVEKYIDNDISEVIAERHNINIRTYFRKLESAEKNFYSNMVKLGYNAEKIEKYLAEEKWIIEVYQNFQKQQEGNVFENNMNEEGEKTA